MQNIPLDSINEITSAWLTRVLREGRYLTRGAVSEIQTNSDKSNWASNAILRLSYSTDAMGDKPTKLFVKLCDPGFGTFGDVVMGVSTKKTMMACLDLKYIELLQ